MSINLDGTLGITAPTIKLDSTARASIAVDNDGSFDMNVSSNFKCTPTAGFTLTFTNITAGQSGYISFINTGGYVISKTSSVLVNNFFLSTISTAGTYLISYFSDGTSVFCTVSGSLT